LNKDHATMQQHDIAIPLLPSRSLVNTLAFYKRLGFQGKILGVGDSYAILERGSVELHFFLFEALQPAESSFGCYIRVLDVESIHRDFAKAGLPMGSIPRMDALAIKPWGMKEFAVVDEDGSLLRIGQVL
jgi:hypothetical protein